MSTKDIYENREPAPPLGLGLSEGLGPTPLPTPAGFRTRYRSEPGMIGHYPWTYADHGRRRVDRPSCEYEDLFTADQMRAAVAAERERCAKLCEQRVDTALSYVLGPDCAAMIREG